MNKPPVPLTSSELWNCEHAFDLVCPQRWSELDKTEQKGQRHCNVCNQIVYLCTTPEEFVRRGNQGQCVATKSKFVPSLDHMMILGRPSIATVKKEEQRAQQRKAWWQSVSDREPNFHSEQIQAIGRRLELAPKPDAPSHENDDPA